eukprot:757991-Hanusia_phi.AAC.13
MEKRRGEEHETQVRAGHLEDLGALGEEGQGGLEVALHVGEVVVGPVVVVLVVRQEPRVARQVVRVVRVRLDGELVVVLGELVVLLLGLKEGGVVPQDVRVVPALHRPLEVRVCHDMVPAHRVQEVGELAQVDRVHRVRLDGSLVVDLRRVVVVLHLSHKRRVRAQHVAVPGRLLDGATEESIGLVVLVQHRSQVECKRRQVCPVGRICSHSLLEQPAVVVNGVLASARAEQGEAREHSRVLVLARCQRSGEQALRPGVVLLARLHEVREVEEEVDVIRADLDGPLEHALCFLVVTSHVPEKHREVSQQPGVLRGALDLQVRETGQGSRGWAVTALRRFAYPPKFSARLPSASIALQYTSSAASRSSCECAKKFAYAPSTSALSGARATARL